MDSNNLAHELEEANALALAWIKKILLEPIDVEAGDLLRAQAAASGLALNTQLKADDMRLRAVRADKALERLMNALREKEQIVPTSAVGLLDQVPVLQG